VRVAGLSRNGLCAAKTGAPSVRRWSANRAQARRRWRVNPSRETPASRSSSWTCARPSASTRRWQEGPRQRVPTGRCPVTPIARKRGPLSSRVPQESQVESRDHQDNADVRYQPWPELMPEEQQIYDDDAGCHHQNTKHDIGTSWRFSHRAQDRQASLGFAHPRFLGNTALLKRRASLVTAGICPLSPYADGRVIPTCCIRFATSLMGQSSTILPSARRNSASPDPVASLPAFVACIVARTVT
jgi:hypothetical protein